MTMDFQTRKELALQSLASELPDKSRKGGVDVIILPLIDLINGCSCFYTTSSCSGRISVLKELPKESKKLKKKKAGDWIFISHEQADPDHVTDHLFSNNFSSDELAVFRFEPFILAVDCIDVSAAQSLVSLAISCGFRESGITAIGKRIMVSLRCSIRLEVPIADEGQILVSREYVRYLVKAANKKMEANKNRTEQFYNNLRLQLENQAFLNISRPIPHSNQYLTNFEERKKFLEEGIQTKFTSQCSINRHDYKLLEIRQCNILSRLSALERILSHNNTKSQALTTTADFQTDKSCFTVESNDNRCLDPLSNQSRKKSSQISLECFSQSAAMRTNYPSQIDHFCGSVVQKIDIVGEPVEALFRWGHSTCEIDLNLTKALLIFGGYGGVGRHCRKNDVLILDIENWNLKTLNISNSPSSRMGHSAAAVGHKLFIIGGREDPLKVMNDIWFLDMRNMEWHELKFLNIVFPARHRHASVVMGSCIYTFGGMQCENIYGDFYLLDTSTLTFKVIEGKGDPPCARHSHSMAVSGMTIYLYGGHDGRQILGDLYCFDIKTETWKKIMTKGRLPGPRFSHSMFILDSCLGILGGCPLSQEICFLDLQHLVWKNVSVLCNDSLPIRSTAHMVRDDLVVVGGGSSCYAFGTRFNYPTKIYLGFIKHTKKAQISYHMSNETCREKCLRPAIGSNLIIYPAPSRGNVKDMVPRTRRMHLLKTSSESIPVPVDQNHSYSSDSAARKNSHWVVKIDKNFAKMGKDLLKKLGWLDLSRNVKTSETGTCISFPIPVEAASFLQQRDNIQVSETEQDAAESNTSVCISAREILHKSASFISLLSILNSGTAIVTKEDICSVKIRRRSPSDMLQATLSSLLKQRNLPLCLLDELPKRWERLGDMAVLSTDSFRDQSWSLLGKDLWIAVANALRVQRVARQGRISSVPTRESTVVLLYGENGWVEHKENGILYYFDATKCMFSSGNISEKIRMAKMDCRGEVVVDLFAGIGYFVLPFLLKAGAKLVYACEWNANALVALRRNIKANGVENRCIILEGDNRVFAPKGVANRVCLGLLPSSELSWTTAVESLRPEGGILHVHGNVKDTEQDSWTEYLRSSIEKIALAQGRIWHVNIQHVERVKWYAPHIRHLVVDIQCGLL